MYSYATGTVSGTGSFDSPVGGLVGGNNEGTVSNCYSTGDVIGNSWHVGGLVGYNDGGTVSNSYATGDVSGSHYLGGLLGYNRDGTVSNSYATGSVSGGNHIGGLVGLNRGMVSNSYTTGSVSGDTNVGGLVGSNSEGTVENSFWDTETGGPDNEIGEGKTTVEMMRQNTFTDAGWDFSIPGTWVMAGYPHLQWEHTLEITNVKELQMMKLELDASYTLMNDLNFSEDVGWDDGELIWNDGAGFDPIGTYDNSFTGVFDGQNHHIYGLKINRPSMDFVGLFGYVRDGEVRNVVMHDVCVSGDRYVGRLVGENWGGTVNNSSATGNVSGSSYVGGLLGFNWLGAVHNSYDTGSVSGSNRVGGLVGSIYDGTVSNSYATGNVSGSSHVGGLVGENWFGTVGNSYSTGSVSGENEVGGLVGRNYDGTVENSYATGNVKGDLDVGGFVGMNSGGTVLNSYATGNVSGDDRVGGLVGSNFGSVSNSFYDTNTTGQSDTWKGTPKTTVEMKTLSTFTDAGWDFDEIWHMVEGITYPLLQWEEMSDTYLMVLDLEAHSESGGWNYVSFNIELVDDRLETIFSEIEGDYDRLMYYDASTDRWLSYVPGRVDHYNNLHSWNHRMGIWIRMTGNATLTVEGYVPMSTDITLYPGWNMVGLPSESAGNHGLPAEVTRIGYFDAMEEYNVAYTYDVAAFVFEPGQGYWVYNDADEAVVWTVDY